MAKITSLTHILYVSDMAAARSFYEAILPGLTPAYASDHWTSYPITESAVLALHGGRPNKDTHKSGLSIMVEGTDGILDKLKAGGGKVLADQPPNPPIPSRIVDVMDPDGNQFQITELPDT